MKQFVLIFIIFIAAIFRLYGLNWDQGHHLHPDERAIVMFTTPLSFPSSIKEFMSETSPWNPHFFAYGSFPIYLLKIVGNLASTFNPLYLTYGKINLVGRFSSAIFDIGTLIVLFLLGKKLFNSKIALLGAFFYGVSILPIQLSHFYAVDTILTFLVLSTLYQSIRLYEKPTISKSLLVGFFFGLSLATKISAIALLSAIGAVLIVDLLLIFLKNPHRPHVWLPHLPKFLKRLFADGLIITFITIITFILFEPYALLDSKTFWLHNMQQRQMTYDAFTFPYTLQYVGKIPYLYELKNIFLWGQGPILATLSFLGVIYVTFRLICKHLGWWNGGRSPSSPAGQAWEGKDLDSSEVDKKWGQEIILLTFFVTYFLIVGKFAIGFMRYLLPIYPLLCLFGAVFFLRLMSFRASRASREISFNHLWNIRSLHALCLVGMTIVIILVLLWPLSFMHIYTKPNTRVLASQWIYQNIPSNSIIAREHWDDGMPIGGNISYQTLELPIYEMQNPLTENQIYQMVQQADYIIIASNRLYTPLQRISKNCENWNLPLERCSHNANRYYEKLFNGGLGFVKVAEFAAYPTIPILDIPINDETADESFTVYDHPKVMIFKKTP